MEFDKHRKLDGSNPIPSSLLDDVLSTDEAPGATRTALFRGCQLLDFADGQPVLDFGCGLGRTSQFLQLLGAKVTGVDISAEAVQTALEKFPAINFVEAPKGKVPLDDGAFPRILSSYVHQRFSDLEAMLEYHREVARLLSDDGAYVILARSYEFMSEFCPESPNWSERDIVESLIAAGLQLERSAKLDDEGSLVPAEDQLTPPVFYLIKSKKGCSDKNF